MVSMFGIGVQEMIIILVVVLIVFGPKRLPDLAKSMGKGLAEFKKASEEVRRGMEEAVKEETVPDPPKSVTPPSEAAVPPAAGSAGAEPPPPVQENIPFSVPSGMEIPQENRSATAETGVSGDATTPRQG